MINGVPDERDKEWVRRRQMRLVQVRKQSNDMAKQLRVRVNNEERERRIKKENEVKAKLELWKIKHLKDLEEMYRNAVNDIGTAHKLASQDPETNVIVEEKQKVQLCRAKERGETAMEHALREKREAIEKKLIPIQRKLLTRQIEDLRSSLVCSIPPSKESNQRNVSAKNAFNPKLFDSSYEDKKLCFTKVSYQEEKNKKPEKKTIVNSSDDHIRSGQCSPCSSGKQKSGNKLTKKTKRRPDSPYKTKTKPDLNSPKSCNISCREGERFWINLGAIEANTEVEDEPVERKEDEKVQEVKNEGGRECQKKKESKGKVMKNGASNKKVLSEKERENDVECYSYSVRHKCKLKNDISSVKKTIKQTEPDPKELARQEQEELAQQKKEKENKMMMAQERGYKAIEKEKINRNYNELLAKLDKLSTKEKLIKTYCHIPPPHMFMSDERRQEKLVKRQRIMDSKFEKIYYETMGINPESDLGMESKEREVVHDTEHIEEKYSTKLDIGEVKCNLKPNSPESIYSGSCEREGNPSKRESSPVEKVSIKKTPSSLYFKRTKISKGGEIFLSDIDRLLKKTRKLRQDTHRSSEHPPSECKLVAALNDGHLEKEEEKKNTQTEDVSGPTFVSGSSELGESISLSPCEGPQISEVLKVAKKIGIKEPKQRQKGSPTDLGMGDLGRDFSGIRSNTIAWPVHQITLNPKGSDDMCARSSTTSYRSLPSQIIPKRINSLLKLLAQLKEREGMSLIADELIVKMEETLDSLIQEAERNNVTLDSEDCSEFQFNPQLNYYITKLLTMSRERIANLSVSSESDASAQKREEGASCGSAGKAESIAMPENKYLKQMNKSSKCSNLKRAKELERVVTKWKRIIEQSLKKCPPPGENCEDSLSQMPQDAPRFADEMTLHQNSSVFDKYEEVSKKCSACISGLSSVLAGVRKEVPRGGEYSGDEYDGCSVNDSSSLPVHQCGRVPKQECPRSRSSSKQQEATGSCERSCLRRSTASGGASRSASECRQSANDSQDSLPNVMEELLKKGLISSPFHWDAPENEFSYCSGCLEPWERDMHAPSRFKFACRPTCRGACNLKYTGKSEAEKNETAQADPEALRALRKKLEKIPMKYVDPRYGVYSPIPVPRPISISPKDPEFIKTNFGQPLFGFPVNDPDPECKRQRQLYFKVAPDDRPSSESRICDRSHISGSESDRQISSGGTKKRPRSTSSSRQDMDTYILQSVQENPEDCQVVNNATFVKADHSTSGGVCYTPATATDGGINKDGGGTFILDRNSADQSACRREKDSQSRWTSGNCRFADSIEGAGSSRGEMNTWIKSLGGFCAGSCAVHCNKNSRTSMFCARQPLSRKDRSCGSRSPDRMTSSVGEAVPGRQDNRYSLDRQAQGGCPYQGMAYSEGEDDNNAEGRFNLEWGEDFLEGLGGDDCDTGFSFDR